jgi:hypothetical protein
MAELEQLKKQIATMEKRIKSLQESVGRWRRKAQGAKGNFSFVSERHEHGKHYISISLPVVPADSTIHEVQKFIRHYIIPKYDPYRYWNVYSSKRLGGWVVTLWKEDHEVDMNYFPSIFQPDFVSNYIDDEESDSSV